LVNVDLCIRYFALDEIVLRFHRSHIVLRASLQHKSATELREIWLGHDIKPDILREDFGKPCHYLCRRPPELLEVDNVRLHKDGATIAEDRQAIGLECYIGKLLY